MSESAANLWSFALGTPLEDTTDNVIPLMEEQCRALEKATNGRVRGRFSEVKWLPGISAAMAGGMLTALAESQRKLVSQYASSEEDALPQKDIGSRFDERTYAFDVYSDDYKFRSFELTFGPVYPVRLSVDETIWRDSREEFLDWLPLDEQDRKESVISLSRDSDLMGCFKIIVGSRKMRYILGKLMADE